jgi:ABC-2 type transport system ATP-binding protein
MARQVRPATLRLVSNQTGAAEVMPDRTQSWNVLEVINLSKRYGDVLAVDRVDLELAQGEMLGLLGPNGAGKTSILEIIEGLRTPDGGQVRLFGEPGGALRKTVRARLGIQLQSTAMLPNLTVLELLGLQASFYPRPLAVREMIESVGLTDKAGTLTSQLSGGQQQRLAIGLALIGRPDLVLLDEPTTGLDPAARRELWSVLQGLRADGRSVLLTTHYMEEAEALCDRVAILDAGRIVAIGSVAELAAKLGGDRVVFAADDSFDAMGLAQIPAVIDVGVRNGVAWLTTTDAAQTLTGLIDHGRHAGRLPRSLAVRRPSLEEIYLEMTGHPFDAADAA